MMTLPALLAWLVSGSAMVGFWGPPALTLAVVLLILFPGLSGAQYLLVLIVAFAIPLAAQLSAWLTRAAVAPSVGVWPRSVGPLIGTAAALGCLSSKGFEGFILATSIIEESATAWWKIAAIGATAFNSMVLASTLVAAVLSLIVVIVELPARWILGSRGAGHGIRLEGVRLLLVVLSLSIGFDVVAGTFRSYIEPLTIVHGVR